MSKIKNWIKGTGSFEVKEVALYQGNREELDTFWNTDTDASETGGVITFTGNSEDSSIWAIKDVIYEFGKRYKTTFRTVSSNFVDGSSGSIGLQYMTPSASSVSVDDNGVDFKEEGWHTYTSTYLNDGTGAYRLQPSLMDSSTGDEVILDSFSVVEIPPLPTITTGTKYLECTSDGTAAIPSKQAYGTWEFDVRKNADSSRVNIHFISDENTFILLGQEGYYFTIHNNDNAIWFYRNNAGSANNLFLTANNYVDINTNYRIKITRSEAGVFTAYIKGGSFGWDNWTTVSIAGGSGTNPVTDNTYTTSNYFVADLDAGDKIANIKILDGVKQ